VAKERELLETKSKLADLSQEHLVQEEDHKRRLGELASRNKSLVKERKRNNKEKAKLNDENTRLKAELDGLKRQLKAAAQEERRKKDETLQTQKRNITISSSSSTTSSSSEDNTEGYATEIAKLKIELRKERDLLKQMAVENQKLSARVQQLMIENEELKLSGSITQTDHLNRKLLMSFMHTMDSLQLEEQEGNVDGEWETDEEQEVDDFDENADDTKKEWILGDHDGS